MERMKEKVLRVHHYGSTKDEDRRITLSPNLITTVAAHVEDIDLRKLSLREVCVLFSDGGSLDLVINHADLTMLEEAIGTYFMDLGEE